MSLPGQQRLAHTVTRHRPGRSKCCLRSSTEDDRKLCPTSLPPLPISICTLFAVIHHNREPNVCSRSRALVDHGTGRWSGRPPDCDTTPCPRTGHECRAQATGALPSCLTSAATVTVHGVQVTKTADWAVKQQTFIPPILEAGSLRLGCQPGGVFGGVPLPSSQVDAFFQRLRETEIDYLLFFPKGH